MVHDFPCDAPLRVPCKTPYFLWEMKTPAIWRGLWFGSGLFAFPNRPQYDVAPDGRFLINFAIEDTALPPITLLQNWKAPAK